MKLKSLLGIFFAFLVFNFSTLAQAYYIVNIDARAPNDSEGIKSMQTLNLDAGDWTVTPVSSTDYSEANYIAWNAWGSVNLPDNGWINWYNISIDGSSNSFGNGIYGTPEEALSNAISANLYLSDSEDVTFYIGDSWWSDNLGGMSLKIEKFGNSPVPEPATFLLLGLGLLGITRISRKKK